MVTTPSKLLIPVIIINSQVSHYPSSSIPLTYLSSHHTNVTNFTQQSWVWNLCVFIGWCTTVIALLVWIIKLLWIQEGNDVWGVWVGPSYINKIVLKFWSPWSSDHAMIDGICLGWHTITLHLGFLWTVKLHYWQYWTSLMGPLS